MHSFKLLGGGFDVVLYFFNISVISSRSLSLNFSGPSMAIIIRDMEML